MTKGFMGSDVFGSRVGLRIPMRDAFGPQSGIDLPKKVYSMGQSRSSGVEFDPSAETLCNMLKKALAVRTKSAEGPEWGDFWSALDRLRPLEKQNGEWRASIYHQMALTCPDEVARLRSIPGAQAPTDKCVKLGTYAKTQILSTLVEPYLTKGWTILRIPVPQYSSAPYGAMEKQLVLKNEIWACPPGEGIPEKTALTAQEASDLARSLGEAIGPVRFANPEATSCVKDSQADLAVTERLLDRLGKAASENGTEPVDVTQDEVDAANKIIDCASKLGAMVSPPPSVLATGGISPLATAGIVGSVGAAAALLML